MSHFTLLRTKLKRAFYFGILLRILMSASWNASRASFLL